MIFEISQLLQGEEIAISRSRISKFLKRYREDRRPRYSKKTGGPSKITNELCERSDQAYTANPEISAAEARNIVLREKPGGTVA